jgi:peptidoglycan/xylan/chitin deacetylase (PgdA/CDA1 family)
MTSHNFQTPLLLLFVSWMMVPEAVNSPQEIKTLRTIRKMEAPLMPNGSKGVKQVPVLCYHQIRDWESSDSKSARTYILCRQKLHRQLGLLKDSGYHFILPRQLFAYYSTGAGLPGKPVMLTFDDATASQYANALPELAKADAKAVFFIMTVVLGKPKFMTAAQVRSLSDMGHIIGCHTWNHHDVRHYNESDWKIQLTSSKSLLEKLRARRLIAWLTHLAAGRQVLSHISQPAILRLPTSCRAGRMKTTPCLP